MTASDRSTAVPRITYIESNGTRHTIEVELGSTVMEGARRNGIPGILAICGGACSCSTCHVYVDADWIDRLPAVELHEEVILDYAWNPVSRSSRLSCQLQVTKDMDGLIVRIPAEQS